MKLLAMQLPTWLVDIWSAYSDVIVPALMGVVVAILTWLAISIKADAKTRAARSKAELEALEKMNAKEDTRPELDKLKDELNGVKQSNTYLAEMIDLAFQNSTLDENTKNALTILKNKILFGVENDIVAQLTAEKKALEEKVEGLENLIQTAATVVNETSTETTRTRR